MNQVKSSQVIIMQQIVNLQLVFFKKQFNESLVTFRKSTILSVRVSLKHRITQIISKINNYHYRRFF